MQALPGFFGKLASHGDFVARRLPPPFVAAWDGWLQDCLQASRQSLGDAWLDAYLTAPVWRFALAPGVCDTGGAVAAWAGVLMPSVDRVGRHFPLTLAASTPGPLPLDQWLGEAGWYGRLEALALSTLEPRFNFDDFDSALCGMAGLPAAAWPGAQDLHGWRWNLDHAAGAAGVAAQVAVAALHGHSVWWTDGSDRAGPCLRLFRGLPPPQSFAAMLAG